MEEHHQAYFHWKELGIKNAWCWHFDAHLDIGREGLDPLRMSNIASSKSAEEVAQKNALGNCYLPWGGLHCGNYLYPAIKEGIVSRLTWIIPPYLPTDDLLNWARRHLDGWFELSLAEHASLSVKDGSVSGTVLGIPIEIAVWQALKPPSLPILLDIDLDYFLTTEGSSWCEPDEVATTIKDWQSLCTTVAYSVKGGYTPTEERRLGKAFLKNPLEPGYAATTLDKATTLYRCNRYPEAISALAALKDEHPVESSYYIGSCQQKLENFAAALSAWEPLCLHPQLPTDGRAYLYGLCGEVSLKLKLYKEAIILAQLGSKLAPHDYRHPWTEAVAVESLGDVKKAIKLVRRALRLAENTMFGLRARLALARLYRRNGQHQFYKAELGRLAALDLTGEYLSTTML